MIHTISRTISYYVVASIALMAVTFAAPGIADDAPGEDAPYVEQAAYLVTRLQGLETDIEELRAEAKGASGNIARIINRRLERKVVEALEVTGKLARITLEEESSGGDVSAHRPRIIAGLEKMPDALLSLIAEIHSSLRELDDASADTTGKDKLALVKRRNQLGQRLEILYRGLMDNREMAQAYGLDVSTQEAELKESLSENAARLSIALELAKEDVDLFELQASEYPDDKDIALAFVHDLQFGQGCRNRF
jgi:hypothetical protein